MHCTWLWLLETSWQPKIMGKLSKTWQIWFSLNGLSVFGPNEQQNTCLYFEEPSLENHSLSLQKLYILSTSALVAPWPVLYLFYQQPPCIWFNLLTFGMKKIKCEPNFNHLYLLSGQLSYLKVNSCRLVYFQITVSVLSNIWKEPWERFQIGSQQHQQLFYFNLLFLNMFKMKWQDCYSFKVNENYYIIFWDILDKLVFTNCSPVS